MKRSFALSIALVLLVALTLAIGGGALLRRWMIRVDEGLEGTRVTLGELAVRLDDAEARTDAAEVRSQAAEVRAEEGEHQAELARGEAATAQERATLAQQASELAEQERQTALLARAEAERQSDAARVREEAALVEATAAYEAATAAREDAERARNEAVELRRSRERELARLEGALGELAETRRTALGLVMNLGQGVEFDFDRAELRPENRELLARIAGVLMTAGDYSIQVYGHTDDVGNASYNQQLSERRAQSVVDYLVGSGIKANIISATGLGKSQPLVDGTTEEARQRNRRVEIAVISYNEDYEALPPNP
jgi:outer membrane protein OmpA-like peptidoglycan-associated protein